MFSLVRAVSRHNANVMRPALPFVGFGWHSGRVMASAVFSSPINVAGKMSGANRILMLLLLCGWIANGTYAMADDNAKPAPFRLITLDPGHFHAALVQKFMYADVDPLVHVYAPAPTTSPNI
jgi:hypothetical protein